MQCSGKLDESELRAVNRTGSLLGFRAQEKPAKPGDVLVRLNGTGQGKFKPTGRIIVYGQEGNDNIEVTGRATIPAWLYGGTGNDLLIGGAGSNVLLGGDGNDRLLGRKNPDILIGGPAAARVSTVITSFSQT